MLHSLTDLFEVAMSHRIVVQGMGVVGAGVVIVGVAFLYSPPLGNHRWYLLLIVLVQE